MNKVYKVVWNASLGVFVAVSELASARGKSSSTTNNAASSADKKVGIFKPVKTALVLSMLFVLPHSVMAAENVDANNLTVAGTSTFTGAATFNGGITTNGKQVATSDQITNLETKKADKTAVDALDTKKADKTAVDALDTKKADKTAVDALDAKKADKTAVDALSNQVTTLGLTNEYTGIKYFRVKSTEDDAKAKATDSVAVGPKAYTETSATKGIAIGNAAQAGSKTSGEVTYDGADSLMIGDGKSSLAIGDSAAARGNQNIAIGKSALTTNKDAAKQFSTNNIAIGTETKTIAASNAIALGNQAVAGAKGAVADSAIAIGDNAKALAADATAVGHLAQAGNFGLAAGTNAQATGQASVALGQNAQALPWRTISIGQDAGKNQAADKVGDKNEHINIGVQAGENIDGQLNISIGQKAGSDTKGKGNIALGQNAGQFTGGTNSSVGNNIAIGTNANKFASNTDVQETTAIGFGAKASGTRSVALGKETKSTAVDSVAIGTSSEANGASSVAIGLNANVNGADNVALGSSSVANTKAGTGYLTGKTSDTVVSVGNDQLQRRIVNVADGADDQDAVTVAQLKRVSDEVYNKVNTQINGITAAAGGGINYDNIPRNAETNSITLSKDNKNTIIGNVAEGTLDTDAVNVKQLNQTVEENKTHYFSTKVNGNTQGNYNNNGAEGDISLAIGMDVRSTGDRSVTVGNRSTAESKGGIAIGALYDGSAALDDNDAQNAVQTVAKSSDGQPFEYNMAIGAGTTSEGNNSIAIGSLAKTSTKQQNNTSPDRAIAIGYFAAASDVKANAIGDRATSSGQKANAFGSQATATAISSTAIGTVAQAQGENSIAMGTHQRVTGANSGSIGYAGTFNEEVMGRDISGTHADNSTRVSGKGTYSVGNTNSDVTSNESGIFGNDNFVQAKENVRVVGNKNTVSTAGNSSLKDVYITGHNNQVDGAAKLKDSKNLFVMGAANKVGTKDEALTITDSYVIGTNNTINTSNTASASDDPSNPGTKVGKGYFILGNNVTATKENSVYLGTDSAYIDNGNQSAQLGTPYNSATIDGVTYNYAGGNAAGVVTVGNTSLVRRIQGVAAGKVAATSTDAINGSQLYEHTRPLGFAADNTEGLTNPDNKATATNNYITRSSSQAIKFEGGATTTTDNNIAVKVKPAAEGGVFNTIEVKLAEKIDLGKDGSVTAGDTTINDNGLTINGGPSVTKDGIDAGNKKITNVAAGEDDTDAVNVKQLKDSQTKVKGDKGVNITSETDVNTGATTYNVEAKVDGTTVTINDKNEIAAVTTTFTPSTDGSVGAPVGNGDSLVTANTVADAINNSGWKATSGATGSGVVNGTTEELINPSETVTFQAGDNMVLNQAGNVFTYSLNKDININSVQFNDGPKITNDGDNIKVGDKDGNATKITNVADGVISATSKDAVNGSQLHQAVNNINTSIAASKEEVKSTDGSVTVSTTQNAKGANVYDLSVNTDGTTIKKNADGSLAVNTTPLTTNTDGKVNTPAAPNALATAGDIANAINNSGWKLVADGTDGTELINPSDTVTFKTGSDNLTVTRTGADITYDLANDITIGKDGKPGSIGVAGQDGKDGVSIKGDTGKDGEPGEATITVGRDGKDGDAGIDGKVGVNGKDGSAVVLNGKDGSIGLNGKDGKDGLSLKSADGAQGVDGTNGADGLPGKDGKTRLVYQPTNPDGTPNGDPEQVATLNDGLIFTGNNEELNRHKLNTVVKVVGEGVDKAASADFKSATGNINVVADKKDTLEIQLNRDLKDLGSATFVEYNDDGTVNNDAPKTTVNNDGITITPKDGTDGVNGNVVSVTKDGLNNGGNNIVNVKGNLAPTYNTGDMTIGEDGKPTTTAATAPTKSQVAPTPAEAAKIYNNAATVGDVLNSGWNLQGNGTAVDFVKPYDTVNFVNGANTAVNVTASEDGKTNEVIVNVTGLPISFVNEAGDTLVKVGDKFYKTEDVENGKPKQNAQEQKPAGTSLVGGDGNKAPQTLANVKSSIEDGTDKSFKEKLAAANDSNPNNAVNVSDLKTAVDDLIGPSDIGGFGLKDKQGDEFKQSLGTTAQITGDDNINTKVIDAVDADGKPVVDANGKPVKALEVSLNNDITIGKDGKPGSIGVAGQDGKDGVSIKGDTGKDGKPGEATITVGRDGKDGDAGIDGKVGVNGKDGSAVVLNGKDGSIGLNGKDGKDGLSLKSADGAQGVDGTNGADGLPGKDGKTRLVYQPTNPDGTPNGDPEQVATLNDGLIFTGNNEELNRHKLNTVVKVVGEGVDKAASADFKSATGNINVVADKNDKLEIQLNRDLKDLGSATFVEYNDDGTVNNDAPKTTVNNDGITITPKDGETGPAGNVVSVTKDGLNNGGNTIVNVAKGTNPTDAVNVSQLKDEIGGLENRVNNRIGDVADDANAGVSSAMAMAVLPQAYIPGKSMLTGGMATYNGQGAVAVGFSKLSDNGRWVLKISGSADTEGNAGGAVGAGFHF